MTEENKPRGPDGEQSGTSFAGDAFPSEPFACPACGQMLAPSCRVCVACKQAIDPSQIKTRVAGPETVEPTATLPALEPVRFPWLLFFILFGVRLIVALIAQRHFGLFKTELMLGGVEFASAVWVFQDAQRRRVPKPLRWGLGSLLLWLLFFPWYLARRRRPEAPCPFVEAEVGPVARGLFLALMVFFLLVIIIVILKGQ